jgi:hypothetical protein
MDTNLITVEEDLREMKMKNRETHVICRVESQGSNGPVKPKNI